MLSAFCFEEKEQQFEEVDGDRTVVLAVTDFEFETERNAFECLGNGVELLVDERISFEKPENTELFDFSLDI